MKTAGITCVEGEPFEVDANTRQLINLALTRVQNQVGSRFWPLADKPMGRIAVSGVVGSVSLPDGRALEIVPKTEPNDDWMASVLALLLRTDRIDAAGDRRAGLSAERPDLRNFVAVLYAERLEDALKKEGPLLVLRRQESLRSSLRGKLNTSQWLRHAFVRPHLFPSEQGNLTSDNDFASALAYVAWAFARETKSHSLRSRLLALQRALSQDSVPRTPAAGVGHRALPSQWVKYRPAWDIAQAVLNRNSLLGPFGMRAGFSIVIEMWPLLERLLRRTLSAAVEIARREGICADLVVPPTPYDRVLLTSESDQSYRTVIPDGLLYCGTKPLASLDAKYKKKKSGAVWPSREDIYQVITTAATVGAPIAILAYPESFDPKVWEVEGLGGNKPVKLVAIGLNLFSFTPGEGDESRGRELLNLLTTLVPEEFSCDLEGAAK